MPTINVRNIAQAALLEMEIKGQLSDGHWENTRPFDHWEPWCRADVAVNPANLGRDFWVRKCRYGLTSKDLLDVVGGRMERYARLAITFGLARAQELEALLGLDGGLYEIAKLEELAREEKGNGYWHRKLEAYRATDLAKIAEVIDDAKIYDRKRLLADLRDLKRIFRMYRTGAATILE